jgi:ribosomal protection tetracycline resistance protein
LRTLNLGIVAHVDAGKTSLTERVLYEAGAIPAPGSVDAGDTRTDTMALERERGITIRSAVAAFRWRETLVNLLDTPGHSDFVAEVERALAVLDAAVLVVSAVEGVQAQTLVLMRALQRLRLPTVVFVNKLDRTGADPERVLTEIAERLTHQVIALGAVDAAGTRHAAYQAFDPAPGEQRDLWRATRRTQAYPLVFGSALTGAGVSSLLDAVTGLAPRAGHDAAGPAGGVVFKVERTTTGERRTFVRMTHGALRVRERLAMDGALDGAGGERVTGIEVFEPGGRVAANRVAAGRIAVLRGPARAQVGDRFGPMRPGRRHVALARPSLETVVDPLDRADAGRLFGALAELAEQDPLIGLRRDERRGEIAVSLCGEVQKQVLAAVLADDYGVTATFRPTTAICVERLAGTGSASRHIDVAPNPFLATVGLRVEPAEAGSGLQTGLEVEPGSMPPAFFTAVEEGVRATLSEGVHGWPVPDARVVVTHSGYYPRQSHMHGTFDKSMSSTAGDFRSLARLVLAEALVRARTVVCAPVHRFELEVPEDLLGAVLAELPRHHAVPMATEPRGSAVVLTGDVPADAVHGLVQRLPHLTRGEGVLTSRLDHHAPVTGPVPGRPRVLADPFAQVGDWSRISRGWPQG